MGTRFLYRKNASSYPYFHKEKMVEIIHIMRLVFYNHAEIANVYF
ncbi:restriction endonuclease [Listeria monocytogenes]|nr:restriction endonuclease [Listeria monocytogenes]